MLALTVRRYCFILAIASWSTGALSDPDNQGDEIGNGGHVVSCIQEDRTTLQALDAFEAMQRRLPPILMEPSDDIFADAIKIINRLEAFDPERAARYRDNVAFVRLTHRFVKDMTLPVTSDSGAPTLPVHCRLAQAIVQLREPVEGNAFFLISEPIWDALDHTNRVVMILHEAIYWDSIRYHGQTNAAASRRINELLFSNEIADMDDGMYRDLRKSWRLDVISWRDLKRNIQWLLSKADYSSPGFVNGFCVMQGMATLTKDLALDEAFAEFMASPVARYHFGGSKRRVWLDRDQGTLTMEGFRKVIDTSAHGPNWGICARFL